MTTIHDVACTTFTFTCPWGCTVHVVEGQEQAHTCAGTSLIVDAMRTAPEGATVLEYAEHIARLLDPDVRVLKHGSWETGLQDGRSGGNFAGIDP